MSEDLYIKSVSFSQVWSLMRDPWEWGNSYLLGNWDNTTWLAPTVGNICHKFVETLLRTNGDETRSVNKAYSCLYKIGNDDFYIDPDEFNKPIKDLTPDEILSNFKTKKINFGKSSMKDLLKKVDSWIKGYLSEKIFYWDILAVEKRLNYEISDVIGDKKFVFPVTVTAIPDIVCRLREDQQLVNADKEVVTIKANSIYLEDLKFTSKFQEINIDSAKFFFQAMFLYYTVKREFWEEPSHINFRQVKVSKNRDGSSQQQVVTFFYSWEDFEIAKTDFWRYMIRWFELVKFYQNGDLIFNVFDFQNWDKAWAKQKAYYRDIPVGQLKQNISISNRSSQAGNNFSGHSFNLLDKGEKIKGESVDYEIQIEDIIRAKLLEFWLPIQYEKTNKGYAYNQLLFTPGRGVEMSRLEKKLKELQQATGFEQIRIEAPVPGTKFVGVEYPRRNRDYLEFSKYNLKKRWLKIPVGNNLSKKTTEVDLTDSNFPHLLVAGTTWSGKSEWLKVAVESLIDKCELWLIDPKMVEFADYEGVSNKYLTWEEDIFKELAGLFDTMKLRYNVMKDAGVKDITDFNKKKKKSERFNRIVVVIDEFGDLKLWQFGKEIESFVEKITALWRAAGIHLIIATQRPDVKIINGRIKNNIATRICLKVASDIDSKVMLWKQWAEQLLGKGDLIFKDGTKMERLQSFYINK